MRDSIIFVMIESRIFYFSVEGAFKYILLDKHYLKTRCL